jgi:hypothetical protein
MLAMNDLMDRAHVEMEQQELAEDNHQRRQALQSLRERLPFSNCLTHWDLTGEWPCLDTQ